MTTPRRSRAARLLFSAASALLLTLLLIAAEHAVTWAFMADLIPPTVTIKVFILAGVVVIVLWAFLRAVIAAAVGGVD